MNIGEQRGAELWRRIQVAIGASGPARLTPRELFNVQLDSYEAKSLLRYANEFVPGYANARAEMFPWSDAQSVPLMAMDSELIAPLHEVLTAPLDLDSERGRARLELKSKLGLFAEADKIVLLALREAYGTKHFAGADIELNGHATEAMRGFFPICEALGLHSGAFRLSTYSGDAGVSSLFNTLLGERLTDVGNAHGFLQRLAMHDGVPSIVVNGGPLFCGQTIPENVRERILRGDIRFVVHNAADVEALQTLGLEYVGVDVANSLAKKLEAVVIGEQLIVHGAASLFDHFQVEARKATVVLKGFGVIGSAVADAYLRFGGDASSFVVVDTDEGARERARAAGFNNVRADVPDLRANAYGIFIEATNGTGFGKADARCMPKQTVVLTATSGGKGVDINGVKELWLNARPTRERFAAFGVGLGAHNVFADLKLTDGVHSDRELVIVNCKDTGGGYLAFPKNLANPIGQSRLPTSPMLAIAASHAVTVSDLGIHELPPEALKMLMRTLPQRNARGTLIGDVLTREYAEAAAAIAGTPTAI